MSVRLGRASRSAERAYERLRAVALPRPAAFFCARFSFFTLGRSSGMAPPSRCPLRGTLGGGDETARPRRRTDSWCMPDALDSAAGGASRGVRGPARPGRGVALHGRGVPARLGTIRETPASVAELVRSGRVEELRGIGPGIAARLRELVDAGESRSSTTSSRRSDRARRARSRHLGIAPKRMIEIATTLGIASQGAPPRRPRWIARARSGHRAGDRAQDRRPARRRPDAPRPRPPARPRAPAGRGRRGRTSRRAGGRRARWADLSFDLSVVVPTTSRKT